MLHCTTENSAESPKQALFWARKSLHNTTNLHSTGTQAALPWGQSSLIWMQTCRSVAVRIQTHLMEREECLSLLASVTPDPESAVTSLICNLSQLYTCTSDYSACVPVSLPQKTLLSAACFPALGNMEKTEQEVDWSKKEQDHFKLATLPYQSLFSIMLCYCSHFFSSFSPKQHIFNTYFLICSCILSTHLKRSPTLFSSS